MVRVWLVFGWLIVIILAASSIFWISLWHLTQPPLPSLLYSNDQTKTVYLWQSDCSFLLLVCTHERPLLSGLYAHPVAQWSPDGDYIAVSMMDGWMIYPADCLIQNQTCVPTPLDSLADDTRLTWGKDGSTIVYMTSLPNTTINIRTRGCWDGSPAETCLVQSIRMASNGALQQPTWSADGRRFAFIGLQPRGLFVLDADCLDVPEGCTDQLKLLSINMRSIYWPSLSADGEQILYFSESSDGIGQLYRIYVNTEVVEQLTFSEGGISVPDWSRDGRYVAYAGFGGRYGGDLGIYVLDLERRLTVRMISERGVDFTFPAWSP